MRKMRNFKALMAVALAASMIMGGAMTTFAAESGDASIESSGSYEGGEMKYPALSVTLPTIVADNYDYIADPNGLIKATETASGDAAKYADSQFQGDTGIYFLTTPKDASHPKNIYTEKSVAKTVTNENAQNIDVTVKLEKGTNAGDTDIALAASDTFTGTDKELYLAVTDGADKTSALSSTAATVTAMVPGNKDNYEPKYDSTDGYGYKKKTTGLAAWSDCSFYLTGALNLDATWGDNVRFPDIKVTWSYAENTDPETPATPTYPTTTTFTYSLAEGGALSIPCDLTAANKTAITDFAMIAVDGTTYTVHGVWECPSSEGNTSISGNTINIAESWMQWHTPGNYTCYIIFDNQNNTDTPITITVTE